MRIALVTPGFSLNENDWAIPALLNLARALAEQHELHIFSQRYPPRGLYPFSNLTHHAIGGGQKFGLTSAKIWLQTSQAIIRQHQKTPFDLLHAFWADEAGFAAALAGSRLGRPVVVSLGGGELTNLPDINYGAQRFLIRRLTTGFALKRAALVTAGSTYQLNLCRTHAILESKLRLAPLGVDTELFQPKIPVSPPFTIHNSYRKGIPLGQFKAKGPLTAIHIFTLVQAASLLSVKNQRLLLEILAQVKKDIPQIKLNLAGSGPLQNDLVALADQLDLQANLIWQQHVAYPAMPRLYQQSHLYLQTSRHESQSMAVLEAMSCGVPVLGTPVGVVPEVACLPPQSSVEALAAQVVEVFSDETRYQELRGQARQKIETAYSLAVTTQNFLEIYHEVLNLS